MKLSTTLKILFVSILFAGVFQACTSGKKALEKGNYDEAVFKAVNRLRQKPGQKKASQTLREGYPLAHDWHRDNINRARTSADIFKWEIVMNEYAALNRLYNEIQRCPSCKKIVQPVDYRHEEDQARITASKVRYEEGLKLMDRARSGDRITAKVAYNNFRVCNNLNPGYENVLDLMDEAKFYATLKVLVEKIPMHSRLFKLSNEFFENKVNEYLHSMSGNEFVRFYTPEEAQATGLKQPDQIIRMEFDNFTVGAVSRDRIEKEVKQDSVIVGQIDEMKETISYDADSNKVITKTPVKRDVYGTVKAKYKETRISIESKGLLDFKIIDAYSSKVLTQEKFPGVYVWSTSWATFNGDSRALDKDQLAATRRDVVTPDLFPNPQEMFVEFTSPIFNQLAGKMRDFYRNY